MRGAWRALLWHVESCFSKIAQPRREAKAQKKHKSEDVIGEAGRVGVMLLDAQIRLVVEQAIEHIGSDQLYERRGDR